MAKLTLITGAAMSGKTRWAVNSFENCDSVQYLCTAAKVDSLTRVKIIFNESRNNSRWEQRCNFRPDGDFVPESGNIILDSVGDFIRLQFYENSNLFGMPEGDRARFLTREVLNGLTDFILAVNAADGNLIIVSDEVGTPREAEKGIFEDYRKVLNKVNQMLTAAANEVYLSVSGLQIKIK